MTDYLVIGNPPYIDSESLIKTNPELREYCNSHYKSAKGNWDIFCIFIEESLDLCKPDGYSSMIVPNKMLSAAYAQSLRSVLIQKHSLISIRDFSTVPVFPVSVYPIVYLFKAGNKVLITNFTYEKMSPDKIYGATIEEGRTVETQKIIDLQAKSWSVVLGDTGGDLPEKIRSSATNLGNIATVVGAATVSEAYEYKELLRDEKEKVGEDDFVFVNTGTIDRYAVLWGIQKTKYIKRSYVKPVLPKSSQAKMSKNRVRQSKSQKIVVGGMNKRLECIYDSGGILAGKSTSVIYDTPVNLLYLLGLMNSKLISYYYRLVFSGLTLQGGYLRIGPPQLKELPIRTINFSDAGDKARHKKMVSLVERMLELHNSSPRTPGEKERVAREIESTDKAIDRLVYELYGLTEEEIKVVEGK